MTAPCPCTSEDPSNATPWNARVCAGKRSVNYHWWLAEWGLVRVIVVLLIGNRSGFRGNVGHGEFVFPFTIVWRRISLGTRLADVKYWTWWIHHSTFSPGTRLAEWAVLGKPGCSGKWSHRKCLPWNSFWFLDEGNTFCRGKLWARWETDEKLVARWEIGSKWEMMRLVARWEIGSKMGN